MTFLLNLHHQILGQPVFGVSFFVLSTGLPGQLNDESTSSYTISRAGDWTYTTIENLARSYWARGFSTRDALYMSLILKRVVVAAAGSGVSTCLDPVTLPASRRPEC